MDPNYDFWNDFFEDELEAKVYEYLSLEWMIENLPHKTRRQADEIISLMRGKDSAANIAAKIAMDVVTLGDLLRNPADTE